MIKFKLKDKKYMVGNTELPETELLSYAHSIEGTQGVIDLPYSIGDEVWRWSSVFHRKELKGGVKKTIAEFTVFCESLCVRFKGSNVPHSIECISPI